MKKSNLIKLFSILLIGIMVIMFSTTVFAADNTFTDITNSLTNSANGNNTNTNASNTNTNVSNTNSANTNTNVSNTNRNNTNSVSIYNDNSLPQTGLEDSIPVAMLVVLFGISSIYAYRKIKEYRNI